MRIHLPSYNDICAIKGHCFQLVSVFNPALTNHDDVIKWKDFPRYWPFVRGIHRSPVNSPHKDQWRGALMFSLICAWINGWVNNRKVGDLRHHHAHYDVTVMMISLSDVIRCSSFCNKILTLMLYQLLYRDLFWCGRRLSGYPDYPARSLCNIYYYPSVWNMARKKHGRA